MVLQAYCRSPPLPMGLPGATLEQHPFPGHRGPSYPPRSMPETTDDSTDGPIDAALRELLDVEHRRQRVHERRQRHGPPVDEVVTLAEVLDALAAHGTPVDVHTASGVLACATVCEVGRDYVAVRADTGHVHLIPFAAVAAAVPVDGSATAAPPRAVPLHLAERLRELGAHRARLELHIGTASVTGRIRRVGADVVALDREDGSDAFIGLAALAAAVVDP